MEKMIRWGILGTGRIAHTFTNGAKTVPGTEVKAIASRSFEKAEAFARQYAISNYYGSYEELVKDPEVDAVYIATPHPFHKACGILALEAGKPVLCEKPFTVNAKEAEEVISLAREKKLFLMEAMWTRYLPAICKVKEWLAGELIGEVHVLKAEFGFRSEWNPEGRLFNLLLGGGALLDVGVYPVSFASLVFKGQQPSKIMGMAYIGETGVDEECSAILGFGPGESAILSGSFRTHMNGDAWILGSKGKIHIPSFHRAISATLYVEGKEPEVHNFAEFPPLFHYEIAEAAACIRAGKLESEAMPLDETVRILKTMDEIRSQWGLKYPNE